MGKDGCGVVFDTPRTGEVAALGMQALRLSRASERDFFRKAPKLKVSRGKSMEGTLSFRGCYKKPAASLKNHKLVNIPVHYLSLETKAVKTFMPSLLCQCLKSTANFTVSSLQVHVYYFSKITVHFHSPDLDDLQKVFVRYRLRVTVSLFDRSYF